MTNPFTLLLPLFLSITSMVIPAIVPLVPNLPGKFSAKKIPSDLVISRDENTSALEKKVRPWLLYFTNQYRKANGLDTLRYDECLVKAAGFHATYLINESRKTQQFKLVHHEEEKSEWFKGKTPSDRAATAGCQKYCGENALYMTVAGLTSAEFAKEQVLNESAKKLAKTMVYDQWHNSKPHRENMLTKTYTSMGVAVSIGKTGASNTFSLSGAQAPQLVAFGVQVFAF